MAVVFGANIVAIAVLSRQIAVPANIVFPSLYQISYLLRYLRQCSRGKCSMSIRTISLTKETGGDVLEGARASGKTLPQTAGKT